MPELAYRESFKATTNILALRAKASYPKVAGGRILRHLYLPCGRLLRSGIQFTVGLPRTQDIPQVRA